MNKLKKGILLLALALAISIVQGTSAFAARSEGAIGDESNPNAAYDYVLKNPLLPWDCVKGYSNTTFIVDYSTINAGFTAYSYIRAESDDGKLSAEKTAYVQKGTNYANTGEVTLDGYSKNCHSIHKSVYSDKGIYFIKSLNSSL